MMNNEAKKSELTIYTIGHSNYSFEDFVKLLRLNSVELVIDVRTSPYAKYTPHFNKDVLRNTLQTAGIKYIFLGSSLGGRPEDEEYHDEKGYILYERMAEGKDFKQGIELVLEEIKKHKTALLCGEENPASCHRRLLVGRVLAEQGVTVLHIRADGKIQSEDEVTREEDFAKNKGQMSLFDDKELKEWKSTQSVSRKKAQKNSSSR
jgi:uncharacterized protein (DUF488 family)